MYLPPTEQVTKEWIRLALLGEKKFVNLADLKPINIGNYPEVSVLNLYPKFSKRKDLEKYFPPKIYKGRTLQKKYFFNVLTHFAAQS